MIQSKFLHKEIGLAELLRPTGASLAWRLVLRFLSLLFCCAFMLIGDHISEIRQNMNNKYGVRDARG